MTEAFRHTRIELVKEGEAIKVGEIVLQPVTEVEVIEVSTEALDEIESHITRGEN